MITVDNAQINQKNQFNQILEMIDLLSIDEQEELINIVRHRQSSQRREEMANNIAIALDGVM